MDHLAESWNRWVSSRDKEAFGELAAALTAPLIAFVSKLLRWARVFDHASVEDLVSKTILNVFKYRNKQREVESDGEVFVYFRTTAWHLVQEFLRRRRAEPNQQAPERNGQPKRESTSPPPPELVQLEDLIESIPSSDRNCVVCCFVKECRRWRRWHCLDVLSAIARVVRDLAGEIRQLVEKWYCGDFSYEEIAAQLGRTPEWVGVNLHRFRKDIDDDEDLT